MLKNILKNLKFYKNYDKTQSIISYCKITNKEKLKIESKINFKINNIIIKKKTKKYFGCDKIGSDYDHFYREVKCLNILKNHSNFPKLIYADEKNFTIYLTYCGELINENNIPSNWKYQLENINLILKKFNIFHNDVWYGNLLIKDGIIYLIDFGWASIYYEDYPYMNLLYTNINNYDNIYSFLDRIFDKVVKKRFEKFPNLHLTYTRPNLFIDYNK